MRAAAKHEAIARHIGYNSLKLLRNPVISSAAALSGAARNLVCTAYVYRIWSPLRRMRE